MVGALRHWREYYSLSGWRAGRAVLGLSLARLNGLLTVNKGRAMLRRLPCYYRVVRNLWDVTRLAHVTVRKAAYQPVSKRCRLRLSLRN